MKHKKIKVLLFVLIGLVILVTIYITISIVISYRSLEITTYKVTSESFSENINIVMLADLHDSRFGKSNAELIKRVREQKPDVIFTVGDMISDYIEDYSYLDSLYEGLSQIAPVYSSLGNHELSHPESDEIKKILRKHSTLLDNEYTEVSINGTDMRIGGLMGYHPSKDDLNEYIRDFANTDKFTLLLSHCPEYYTWGVDEVKIDLMVSGHTHGGQVILPFAGGVYAPEQGWWPEYDYGVFYEENATLVITRGLGSSKQKVPRFNNPPEILCLTLSPEADHE